MALSSPCWGCWTGQAKLSPRRRRRVRFLRLRAQVLQAVVITLNWLTLGNSLSPPDSCRAGAATTPAQDEALGRLEEMIHHFLSAPDADVSELGRAGEKLANLCKAGLQLPSGNSFGDSDLHSFLDSISSSFDPYGKQQKNLLLMMELRMAVLHLLAIASRFHQCRKGPHSKETVRRLRQGV